MNLYNLKSLHLCIFIYIFVFLIHTCQCGPILSPAEFCPDVPHIGENSFWNCNVEDATKRFTNGTHCKVNCAPDYVIPSSQMENDTIACNPPTWNNVETIPVCRSK